MPAPGNIIKTEFSGSAAVFAAVPVTNQAAALVFFLEKQTAKKLTSIGYSLGRNPFVAAGGYDSQLVASATLNNEVFGRLTVFRNFTQDVKTLFEPYFNIDFVTAGPPFDSNFYGPRVDYAREDIVYDLIITKIDSKVIAIPDELFNANDKLTVVLSPFYKAFQTGGATAAFGAYMGDELTRTLSVNGCFGFGGLGVT